MNYKRLVGLLIIIIDFFIIYYRSDIIIEMFEGRSFNELEIFKLILPITLIIISLFFIFNKKKDEKNKDNI